MGYQESYVTAKTKQQFNMIVNRIRALGEEFYTQHGTYPVEIITFNEDLDVFQKGQKAIYFTGERYLQNGLGERLLGYTDEFFEGMTETEICMHIEDEEKYGLVKYFTEEIEPSGIWEDAGKPLKVTHEKFSFYKENKEKNGTKKIISVEDFLKETKGKLFEVVASNMLELSTKINGSDILSSYQMDTVEEIVINKDGTYCLNYGKGMSKYTFREVNKVKY